MPKHDKSTPSSTYASTANARELPTTSGEIRRLQEDASANNADAQYLLGVLHEDGNSELGIELDEDLAIRWYYMAATKGHRDAQFSLAYRMHSQLTFAWPTPAYFSAAEVIRWYKAAAEQGHAEAAWQLYLEFSTDPGDKDQADYWRGVAISLGYDPADPAQDDEPGITDATSTISEQI